MKELTFLKLPPKLPQNRIVAMAVKRMLLRQSAKAGGGAPPAVCECEYHNHAYNELVATHETAAFSTALTFLADGATILSQTITITEPCCVNVVSTLVSHLWPVTGFELERPLGTIVTDQEDDTSTDDLRVFHHSAWEVLPAGIYTYYLVNRGGAGRAIFIAQLKIVAFACTGPPCACEYHTHAYNEMVGTTGDVPVVYRDPFDDGATILSQAITITEECCVLAVGTILSYSAYPVTDFELERPLTTIVVDQENRTPNVVGALFHYSSWEHLTPGIYTYFLVNRAGHSVNVCGAQLKIIAVRCVEV